MDGLRVIKEVNVILKEFNKCQKYFESSMQLFCEQFNINYSELFQGSSPRSSDRLGTSKPEGTPVDAVVDVGDSSRRAESPEDHVVHDTGDADAGSPDDVVVNSDARAKSPEDHDRRGISWL